MYIQKYLKYKSKYLELKSNLIGGTKEQDLLYDVEVSRKDIAFRERSRLHDYYENEANIIGRK